jgi:hypothetical protein
MWGTGGCALEMFTDILEHSILVSTDHTDRSNVEVEGSDMCQAE